MSSQSILVLGALAALASAGTFTLENSCDFDIYYQTNCAVNGGCPPMASGVLSEGQVFSQDIQGTGNVVMVSNSNSFSEETQVGYSLTDNLYFAGGDVADGATNSWINSQFYLYGISIYDPAGDADTALYCPNRDSGDCQNAGNWVPMNYTVATGTAADLVFSICNQTTVG